MGKDRHEQDGVGGEVLKLKAKLLQEQEEEGGDRWHQPAHGVKVKRTNSPAARLLRGILPARILLTSSGVVHPRRRHTESSWISRWKRQG
jgi:hypothetical protein